MALAGCGGGGEGADALSADAEHDATALSRRPWPRPRPAPSPDPAPAPSPAPLTLGFDAQTPEQISLYCPTTRAVDAATTVAVRYRATGAPVWRTGHPLLHVMPAEVTTGAPVAVVDAFAGAIFDLTPGTSYDVELTVTEPGQAAVVLTGTRTTRALHAAAGTPNKTLASGGNLQAALNGLLPGDVLQLANGSYTVSNLSLGVAGTAAAPIYVRGASQAGVVIKDTSDAVLMLLGASHIVLEDLTIEGSSVDSGTAATSIGIVFNTSWVQTNVTIRRVKFVGVDIGIKSYTRVDGCLVYGCELSGNNTWDKAYVINPESGMPNYSWNDDGICLPGLGNAAWNNTLRGFGDAFASYGSYSLGQPLGYQSAAVYFYRNLIEYTCDDACEGDYSTRNIGFYDNYVGNSGTLLSLDPVWGGPFFCFRNTSVNALRGPFKLTDQNSGALIYNNTVLKGTVPTVGGNEYGWYGSNNGLQQGFSFRNNLLVKRGAGTDMRLEFDVGRIDFTHNAWYPNRGFNWTNSGGDFASAAQAAVGLPARTTLADAAQRHTSDLAVTSNPWVSTVTLGADYTSRYTAFDRLALAAASAAKNSGAVIAGITDGFSGAGPDRGAEIAGRTAVVYGAAGLAGAMAWIGPQALNTWGVLPTSNVMADLNPDNDPAVNPNFPGTAPWRSTGNFATMFTAWCGMAFDSAAGNGWWTDDGGHNDKHDNGVYKLELNRAVPRYVRVLAPSGSVGLPALAYPEPSGVSSGDYSDGRGRAKHTYNYHFYLPGYGPGLATEITIAPSGGTPANLRLAVFNETTGARTTYAALNNELGSGCAACVDTLRGVVWKRPVGNAQMAYWTPGTNSWAYRGAGQNLNGPWSLTYIPGHDVILMGNGSDDGLGQAVAGGWQVFDPATGTYYQPSFTGAPALGQPNANGLWPGMCQPFWSARLGKVLAWDNSSNTTRILTLTPGANPRTDAWTIGELAVSGANAVTPSVAAANGTYGRFFGWDDMGICGVMNAVNEAGFFFRYA